MNNMEKNHFCKKCGNPAPQGTRFCMMCGSPLKTSSPMADFFLALLQCLGYYAFFIVAQVAVILVYGIVVLFTSLDIYASDADEFISVYMSHLHEVSIASGIVVLLGYFLFFKIRKKSLFKRISVRPMKLRSVAAMVSFGFFSQIFIALGLTVIYAFFPELSSYSNEAVGELFENGSILLQFLNVALLTGILEEVLFRGLIYTALKRVLPTGAAVFLSAVIFGAAHMNLEQFFYTAMLGVLLALVYEKYGSVFAPMIVHITFNGSNFILMYLNFENPMPYIAMFAISAGILLITISFVFLTKKEPKKQIINS